MLRRHRPHDLARLGIARTLQGVGLCAGLTVHENVMLGAEPGLRSDLASSFLGIWRSSRGGAPCRRPGDGGPRRARRRASSPHRLPAALPYGIQKRTALARALMAEPRLLLLDEPASGLSESEMDALGTLIRGLTDRMAVLLVEHHMDLVMSVCDRIVVLNFGQVIADGHARRHPGRSRRGHGLPRRRGPRAGAATTERGRGAQGGTGVLEVRDLSVSYGAVRALRSVSFDAAPGAVTAVLGANGAGKTTLLRTISGLVEADGGSVRFDGDALVGRSVESIARMGVAHVPEGRGVIEELTVEENLRLATLWCLRKRDRHSRHRRDATSSSRGCGGSGTATPPRSRAASARCSSSAAPSSPAPGCSCSTSRASGLAPHDHRPADGAAAGADRGKDITVVLVEQNARSALSVSHHAVILNLGQVVVSDDAATVAADDALRHHYLGF